MRPFADLVGVARGVGQVSRRGQIEREAVLPDLLEPLVLQAG